MSFMNTVFYLTFFSVKNSPQEGSYTVHRKAFYVEGLTRSWNEMEQYFRCSADQLKQSYEQIDGVTGRSGTDVKICGCSCFSPREKHDQMIERWRKIFHDADPNCVVGPMCEVSVQLIGPTDMLEKTHQAYEQQQSKQLHDTLHTQIHASGVTSAAKKM